MSAGAVGSDDIGEVLLRALSRFGVDCDHVVRRDGVQTSATILPIRPNGDRPALHVIGANAGLTSATTSRGRRSPRPPTCTSEARSSSARSCARRCSTSAASTAVTTSLDILADGWPELLDMLAPAFERVDYVLPNEDQARLLTGETDVVDAARALLSRGAGTAAITCGGAGSVVVGADTVTRIPAFEVEVVDTTGCGDAFSAGFLRGLSLGQEPVEAARTGSATAALVAGGLGSDAGEFDLERVLELARTGRERAVH